MLHNLSQGFLNPIKRLAMGLLATKMPWRARDWRQTRGINFETKHESALSHYGTGFALDVHDENKFWEPRSTLQNVPIVMEMRPCFFLFIFDLSFLQGRSCNTKYYFNYNGRGEIFFKIRLAWGGEKKKNSGGTNVTQCVLEDCWYENINLYVLHQYEKQVSEDLHKKNKAQADLRRHKNKKSSRVIYVIISRPHTLHLTSSRSVFAF